MNLRIDKAELRRLCSDFDLPEPPVRIHPTAPNRSTRGDYDPANSLISLYADTAASATSLRLLINALNRTFLHEFRHYWQQHTQGARAFDDKPGAYWTTTHEQDARDFAEIHANEYRVIRLAPRQARSTLSRLTSAERAIRSTG